MIRSGTYTICLDTNKANEDSYQNWLTIKVERNAKGTYRLRRLTNLDGNGQGWEFYATVVDGHMRLFRECRTFLARSVATLLAQKWNLDLARLTPLNFPNARIWNVSRMKGNKTAAPSLLRRHVRDKNKNNMRRHVERINFEAAMVARNWNRKHGRGE